jgi:hypothetical protein
MKVVQSQFRCDLCGKFRNTGVTETQSPDAESVEKGASSAGIQNRVCAPCVTQAQHLLAAAGLEDES